METDNDLRYRNFLLTFWLDDQGDLSDAETWRFRLEEPKLKRWSGCVGIQALIALLIERIAETSQSEEA